MPGEYIPQFYSVCGSGSSGLIRQRIAGPGMDRCGLFHMHGIARESIVEEHRRLAWHRGQVIRQQLGHDRVLCYCLLPFRYAALEKDRPLASLGNVIAAQRPPHAIALRSIPAEPYPTDDAYGMPGR